MNHSMSSPSALLTKIRTPALVVACCAGIAIFASVVHPLYPIEKWLFWRYLGYWALCALWGLGCASTGFAIVHRLAPELPACERLFTAFLNGVLAFAILLFVGGVLHAFGALFFFGLPIAMTLVGGKPFLAFMRGLGRHARTLLVPRTQLRLLIFLFGLGGLALVYIAVLVPENATADALWYHLAVPERYAAEGRIARYPEGWYMGALPQLASWIYTWAFILPGSGIFDRVELAAHLEFVLLLATLAGIPILVRWMVAPARRTLGMKTSALGSWAALFLFPSIFLYDSSLGMAADHVSAFWAVPIFLALRLSWHTPSPKRAVLFAAPVAGALMTKYQAMVLAALPIAALAGRLFWLAVRRGATQATRRSVAYTTLTCAGAGLALSSVHWLKNWIWYGDPLFPFLHRHFRPHPWSDNAQHLFENWFLHTQTWAPSGTPGEKLRETAGALFTFSFKPHDYENFHGALPVFGSLFTLCLLLLIFLPRAQRVWAVVAAAQAGVGLWYWISHWDRYLQALVPWMAAVVGAVVALSWACGRVARIAVSVLLAFQVVWAGDVPFFPTHALMGQAPAKRAIDLLSSGRRQDTDIRTRMFGFTDVARALPEGANVLLHDMNGALGIEHATVSDVAMWVSGFGYGHTRSPKALWEQWKSYGVTHVLWRPNISTGFDSMAGDLVFFGYIVRYGGPRSTFGGNAFVAISPEPPPEVEWLKSKATVLVCSEAYAPGLYELGDLAVPSAEPRQYPAPRTALAGDEQVEAFVRQSDFVAVEPRCNHSLDMNQHVGFEKMATRNGAELWLRRN